MIIYKYILKCAVKRGVLLGKFCFGSFLKVLTLCSPRKTTQKYLCGKMFLSINSNYDITTDDDTVSHLKNCSHNISRVITDEIPNINITDIVDCFENDIIPILSPDKHKVIVLALIDILLKDDIDDSASIGLVSKKTKSDYRQITSVVFSDFLVDFFIFSISGIDNTLGKPYIQNINQNFIDQFSNNTDNIILQNKGTNKTPLPKTINPKNLDSVFVEVSQKDLGLSNQNTFKIFKLKIEDYEFTYTYLHKFLTSNLGRYVYSRAKMNDYKISEDLESVGVDAIKLLRNHKSDNILGKMLLYSFLECYLNAPKLMSTVELNTQNVTCDGVHLLKLPSNAFAHQLVYGASNLNGDLKIAIDTALNSIVSIKSQKLNSSTFIESGILNQVFTDSSNIEYIKSVIIPQKNNQEPPDMAFGVFLGYTVNIDPVHYNLSKDDFIKAINKKLEHDISSSLDYIKDKISTLKLGMHSFYIYVLPFNDIDQDKQNIVSGLIGGV